MSFFQLGPFFNLALNEVVSSSGSRKMGLQATCSDANSFYFQLERITKDRSLFCNSTCEPWKSLGLRGGEHEGFFGLQAEKIGLKHIWVFPNIGVPQNGWFTMENPIKMDDLAGTRVPLFLEIPIWQVSHQTSFF